MKNFVKIAVFSLMAFGISANANAKIEKFVMDPSHTNITWRANHFGFSNPDGKFAKSSGFIMFDEKNPEKSSVNVTIDTNSVVTGIDGFDKHLKSADFFNVEKFKEAIFVSKKIELTGKDTAKIHGDFTLLGVTKPLILNTKFNKIGEHPFTKKKTIGFSATTVVKRSEFGMNYGIGAVSDDVNIVIEVEASIAD